MQTHLTWTGAVVAFRQGIELDSQATPVGMNTPHRDALFHTMVDTTELAKNILDTAPSNLVIIYMADHQIIPWCLTMDRHDNTLVCRTIGETLSTILFNHLNTNISIRWILGTASFHPLKHLLEVATAAVATMDLAAPQPPLPLQHSSSPLSLKPFKNGNRSGSSTPTVTPCIEPSITHCQANHWNSYLESKALPSLFSVPPYTYSQNMLSQANTM
jgi:hypothetical protein